MAIFKRKKFKNDVEYAGDLIKAILSGDTITRKDAMSLPAVAEAVDLISNTVAMIPVKLYRETEQYGKRIVDEVINDNRTALLNEDTKSTMDGYQFKKAIVTDYLMGKGGYAYIKKYRNRFTSVIYVKEIDIAITELNPDPLNLKYEIGVYGGLYQPYEFIKLLRNTENGMYGFGVSDQIAKALKTMLETMILQYNLAKTGGNKRGYIQSENNLSKDAIKLLKEAWQSMYANNDTHTIPVLNNGITFKESSATSTEMQLNESKKQFNDEIAGIFHTKGDWNDFFKNAVQPILTAFETALNRDFLLEKEKSEYFWAFDTTEIKKGSLKERYEAYKLALESGWLTKNEVRYSENLDAINGLDTINMGLGSVLYDTKTGEYFIPNTNSVYKVGESMQNNSTNVAEIPTNEQ